MRLLAVGRNAVDGNPLQPRPPKSRPGFVILSLLALGLLVCLLLAAWVGTRGALAYRNLSNVQANAGKLITDASNDPSQAVHGLESLANDTRSARDLTSDPAWSLCEHIPWIGPQLRAFGDVAASSDDLLSGSILPLVEAATKSPIEAFRPIEGQLDTSALDDLSIPARDYALIASAAAKRVHDIDRVALIGSVSDAVNLANSVFTQASSTLDALARATQILPPMLKGSDTRNYLILVQNNAEWRSLGGITGTAILLQAHEGTVSLSTVDSATSLSQGLKDPVIDLGPEIQSAYGTKPARYFHNLTQIPDFTLDGPLAQEMYRVRTGVTVDGVIAVDPVVLSYLLSATGELKLPDGQRLNSANAIELLLEKVYTQYADPKAQDLFFASAAASVFDAFLLGRTSPAASVQALARSIEERRLLAWFADPSLQNIIAGTELAGELPTTDSDTARLGVYLNDGTGSKMSYYVRPKVTLEWTSCSAAGVTGDRELRLTVDLTNNAPPDAAVALPRYVTGDGAFGVPPGSVRVVSNIYLPMGWSWSSVRTSDGSGFDATLVQGRSVLTFGAELSPQSSVSISVSARGTSEVRNAQAIVTPTADPSLAPIMDAPCEDVTRATLQ